MSHWHILGIAKTGDEKAIRKAYARILKTIDQEIEADKFIALRHAFEQAKQEAYYDSLEEESDQDSEQENDAIFAAQNSVAQQDTPPSTDSLTDPAIDTAIDPATTNNATEAKQATQDSPVSSTDLQAQDYPQAQAMQEEAEIPLHQRGFEFLLAAIQQQNSDIDLRKELLDYMDYVLSVSADVLSDEDAQGYLRQLDAACVDAGLGGLNDFLNLRKLSTDAAQAADDTLLAEATQPQIAQTSLKDQLEHYKQDVEQLCQSLWHEVLDEQTFNNFSHVLAQWPQQTLEHQMHAYDQLSYVLGSIRDETDTPNRFFKLWYEHFGNDVPSATADAAQHRLHDRINALAVSDQYWQGAPKKQLASLRELEKYHAFRPFKMLQLHMQGFQPVPNMQDPAHNPNVQYLKMALNIQTFWPCLLVIAIANFIIGCYTPLNDQPYALVFGMLFFAALWLPLIQAPVLAILCAKQNQWLIFERLLKTWFFSALAIAFFSPLLPAILTAVLLSAWVIMSTLVLAHALYTSQTNYLDSIYFSIQIVADKLFVGLATLGLIWLFGFMLYNPAFNPPTLSAIFLIFPFMLIWTPDYFKAFFARLFKKPADLIASFKGGNIALLIFAGITSKYLYSSAMLEHVINHHYVNPLYALSLFLMFVLVYIPSNYLAFTAKYAVYLGIIAFCILKLEDLSIFSLIIGGLCGYYLYFTLAADLKLRKLIKEQQGSP